MLQSRCCRRRRRHRNVGVASGHSILPASKTYEFPRLLRRLQLNLRVWWSKL